MTSIWHTPTAILWLLTWLASPPASLGEASIRESLRRQTAPKATAFLTNVGREAEPPPPAVVSGLPAPVEPPDPATAMDVVEPERDEEWWRARIANALAAVERDNLLMEALQSRINALQADVVNIDDPVQQNRARQALARTLAELDTMQQLRDRDLRAIGAIHDEARRLSVPPGWLR